MEFFLSSFLLLIGCVGLNFFVIYRLTSSVKEKLQDTDQEIFKTSQNIILSGINNREQLHNVLVEIIKKITDLEAQNETLKKTVWLLEDKVSLFRETVKKRESELIQISENLKILTIKK